MCELASHSRASAYLMSLIFPLASTKKGNRQDKTTTKGRIVQKGKTKIYAPYPPCNYQGPKKKDKPKKTPKTQSPTVEVQTWLVRQQVRCEGIFA